MNTTKFIVLFVIAAYTRCNYADHKPFCKFPSLFKGTLRPTTQQIDIQGSNDGTWYSVGYKEFGHSRECRCMAVDYRWDSQNNYIDTWYGCPSRGDSRYNNVVLRSQNTANSDFRGWMRFKPNGWFWIPFSQYIIDQAQDGSWQIIADPCREMVFILSRKTRMCPVTFRTLKARLRSWGFDLSNFVEGCDQGRREEKEYNIAPVNIDVQN